MPSFSFRSALVAGTVYNPLIGWQYEFCPFAARVKLICNAPVTTPATDLVVLSITSGSEQIQESAPVQSTAIANFGTLPSELNTPSVSWLSPAGDRLKLNFLASGAGPFDVQGTIYIDPLR